MIKLKPAFRYCITAVIILCLLFGICHLYGSYQYFISTINIRVVDDVNKYEIVKLDSGFSTSATVDDIFIPEERKTILGYPFPIVFDRVDFKKSDFTREYRIGMYKNHQRIFTAYLSKINKEMAASLPIYAQHGRLHFYNINGNYYALEIKGQYLCFSQNQSQRLANILGK